MRKVHIAVEGRLKDEEDSLVICPRTKDVCNAHCAWFAVEDYDGSGYEVPVKGVVLCQERVIGIILK